MFSLFRRQLKVMYITKLLTNDHLSHGSRCTQSFDEITKHQYIFEYPLLNKCNFIFNPALSK